MIQVKQFKNGLRRFIDNELLPSMNGWQKVAVGTVAGLYINSIEDYIKLLPGICKDGMIDVQALYEEIAMHWDGDVPIQLPLIGTITLTKNNLDTLYTMVNR